MAKWTYETKIGTFTIKTSPMGGYDLWIDSLNLGHYVSPGSAADDVFVQATGWHEWDGNHDIDPPVDLGAWARFPG